jgi:hypothetical protein
VTLAERNLDLKAKDSASEHSGTDSSTSATDFRQFSTQQSVSGDSLAVQLHNVKVRNILLDVVMKLVLPPSATSINQVSVNFLVTQMLNYSIV